MMQRTLRHKDNFARFYDELIALSEELESAHHLPSTKSQQLKDFRKNIHNMGTLGSMPDIAELLFHMNVAFLCAERGSKFITSDDPCHLFNPKLQWQRFYGPGLAQKDIEVILPLSPDVLLCLSWGNLRGYIHWGKSRVEDTNRIKTPAGRISPGDDVGSKMSPDRETQPKLVSRKIRQIHQ